MIVHCFKNLLKYLDSCHKKGMLQQMSTSFLLQRKGRLGAKFVMASWDNQPKYRT
jgi:hypothetical protein